MGRNRLRTDAENDEYNKMYAKEYQKLMKQTNPEYYKTTASRSYYRKVLRNMDENDKKYEKVCQKLKDLDAKCNEFLSARNRYGRLDIIEKVNADFSAMHEALPSSKTKSSGIQ